MANPTRARSSQGLHLSKESASGVDVEDAITIPEIMDIAKRKLPTNVFDYFSSGADDELAVARNVKSFDKLFILPRVMRDVSSIDTSVTLFDHTYPLPVGIAPSAMQKLVNGQGELDMARAATKLGLLMGLSSQSTTTLEEVMSVRTGGTNLPQFWHQLYLTQTPEKSLPLIKRAEAAGYEALVLTVDTPVLGNRINERKTPLALPAPLRLANLDPNPVSAGSSTTKKKKPSVNRVFLDARTAQEAAEVAKSSKGSMHSSSMTWDKTLPWLRAHTNMKIILKGVLTPEDAVLAVKYGADGIIVSNHGGRQLDSVPSTLEVLPAIVHAVNKAIPVLFDGGIMRGSDVFKALALGADFVLAGRAPLWGLSWNGQQGVEAVMGILERELTRTMALAGTKNVKEITRDILAVRKRDGFGVTKL